MKNTPRIHYPTCEPCLGHGFQNYKNGPGDLECGRDGAIAVLQPLSKAAITKSIGVAIEGSGLNFDFHANGNAMADVGFKALDVRKNLVKKDCVLVRH